MPVSGLVVRLVERGAELASELARDVRLTLGEVQHGVFLPVVLETRTLEESESVVEELLARDGIQGVDVVTVDFSDRVEGAEDDS